MSSISIPSSLTQSRSVGSIPTKSCGNPHCDRVVVYTSHYCKACGWAYRQGLQARPRIKYRKEPKAPDRQLARLRADLHSVELMLANERNQRTPDQKALYVLLESQRELLAEINRLGK